LKETFQFKRATVRGLSGYPWNVCPDQASCLRILSDHPKITIEFLRAACHPFPSIPGYSSSPLGLFAIPGKAPRSSFAPGKPSALPFQTSEDAFPVRANCLPGTSKPQKARPKLTGCLPVHPKLLIKPGRSNQRVRSNVQGIRRYPSHSNKALIVILPSLDEAVPG
jgi:hypothetical protein